MARPSPRLALALLPAMLLAGCVAPAAEPPAPAALTDAQPTWPSFAMTARDCEEGGFVAAYNTDGETIVLADVWVAADIREEIGNPMRDGVGRPVTGPLFGNWHMGFRCASASAEAGEASDLLFGYVGTMVEPPAWDPGGADWHFLVSGLSFQEGPLGDAFRATSNAAITPTVEARVDWHVPKEAPRSLAYVLYIDGEKGQYEGLGTMAFLREVPERTLRLWWQVPVDGTVSDHDHHNAQQGLTFQRLDEEAEGVWHPVYWDLRLSSAQQHTTPPMDGVQYGTHNMLKFEHGAVPGQPTLSNVYQYDELTLTSGAIVRDVELTAMWNH